MRSNSYPAHPPIGDYGVIGDGKTLAFISKRGSIDWLCLPSFSSPSIFASILDESRGGCFSIAPCDDFEASHAYRGLTPVLETTFETRAGSARLIDLMPVRGGASQLEPASEILRVVEGISGKLRFMLNLIPRPCYALQEARFRGHGRYWVCSSGADAALLSTERPLEVSAQGITGSFELAAGERCIFSLSYEKGSPLVFPPLGQGALERWRRTEAWWEEFARSIHYEGPERGAVLRSALTLKLLTFAPSGAVVAAGSTSLPEAIGGERNWDYRYCWLRDSTLTMRAFLKLGMLAEAEAFLYWLLHATALSQPRLAVLYDVFGGSKLEEKSLPHLSGYRGSRPVRIGNAAVDQLQLDVHGAVIAAASEFVAAGGELQSDQKRLLKGFGTFICGNWRRKDNSIWELRGERKHYTFSKVMCWVGLNRLIRLHETNKIELRIEELKREMREIRSLVEEQGYNRKLKSYVGEIGGDQPDASLLLLACLGYCDAGSARMRSTYEFLQRKLGVSGMLYRYPHGYDGSPSREGTFGVCGFWAIDNLARRGDVEAAMDMFQGLLARASDLGLYAEEMDPATGEALGNFPQAFTHIGLINAATAIAEELKRSGQSHAAAD